VFKENTSKRVVAYIAAFPPIIMLAYALLTYFIFFNSLNKQNSYILKLQENRLLIASKEAIRSRLDTLNSYIDSENNKKEIFNFLRNIKIRDHKNIVIFNKNGNIVFTTSKKIDKKLLPKLFSVTDVYKDSKILIISENNNKYRWKLVSYCNYDIYKQELASIKNKLLNSTKNTLKQSLFLLTIVWFVLLFFSILLATVVLSKLRKYEKKITTNNEKIIFQSRQALLGELLPMIAHQWRQPINKIAAVLMRIRFELANGSPNVDTLDRQAQQIEDSVELMSNTIDDFRTFYRPKEDAEYVDLALLIRKAIYFLDELLERKKIKIKNDLSSIEVKLHANEFLQVIINLIKNASDAVGVKGQISVSLRELKGGIVEIRVEDNGTGIPQDKLEKIFEPHESTKQGSMGLGLYMSKLIIESHFGGIIKAYNTPRGAGFLIRLPKDGI